MLGFKPWAESQLDTESRLATLRQVILSPHILGLEVCLTEMLQER